MKTTTKRRRKDRIFIGSFSIGLDELSRKDQRNADVVLDLLRKNKRFSCFEASANDTIARTMTYLCRERLTTEDMGYPWTRVIAIDGEWLS